MTHKNVILIGMPGSGKSTVGVLAAKALGFQFIDTDLVLQSREKAPLQDLLDRLGTEAFLDLEEAAIRSVVCDGTVISPGGSCVCRPGGMAHLKALGTVVYLELTLDTVAARIHNMSSRGIALEPGQTLADVYQYRVPLYRRYADLTVTADGQTLEETVAAVLQVLNKQKELQL